MTTEKAIKMIDEYLAEPHSIQKDWVELLTILRNGLSVTEKEESTLKKVIALFGDHRQENMCVEECAELIQAINKKHRFLPHNIPEEIADVEITLEQLKIINKCGEEVEKIKKQKINKLSFRVEGL